MGLLLFINYLITPDDGVGLLLFINYLIPPDDGVGLLLFINYLIPPDDSVGLLLFINYLIPQTIAWVSQGLLGFVLTLHMLVATKLATYFIKLEKQHPNDIPKEERLAAL